MTSPHHPLITIGMPVCNAMLWLPEAIESLLAQTCPHFEILAIVDGGSDESLTYLRNLRDPRLRVIAQAKAGVTATLNRILQEARTPWLARQDADDVSYPTRIERLLAAIREYPNAGLIYSLADYHPRGRCVGRFRCSRGSPEALRELVRSGYLLSICHSTATLNIEKTISVGAYRMEIHAEDADLWWRMALHCEIRFISESLVGFRQHSHSVSARHLREQQLAGLYVQYLLLSHLWSRPPRSLDEIAPALLELGQPSSLSAKESLREANMHLAAGRRLHGCMAGMRAITQSPGYVLGRLRDEIRPAAVTNGVPPRLFLKNKEALWF